ncbi:LysM domain/BON superfamily protein [Thalassoglobus neptunius]|uniref:LysM domain/BON superfamily protein n=1 Tax=Thalassoglobus neptunius TaxID=1938619 RepID=A0A5C5X5S2_9PLAN|nr:BON domain-containing protein [Thalassoglobus neptunius]TWT57593.1 LysM domain/BON superfamily protein [Thalassoglobus neptunius]
MLLPRKWALSLGLLAAIPTVSVAGPFDLLQPQSSAEQASSPAEGSSKTENQRVAEEIAKSLKRANLVHKDVAIQFESGTATISGQIKDEAQRAAVSRIVGRVDGVQNVQNQLSLMGSTPAAPVSQPQTAMAQQPVGAPSQVQPVSYAQSAQNNQEVAQNIAGALSSVGMSGYDIEIRYKNGVASLIGTVDGPEQAMRAHQAAASVPGVNQVMNRLTVAGQPAPGAPGGAPQFGPTGPGQPQFGGPGQPQFGGPGQPQFGGPGQMPYGPPQGAPIQQVQGYAPGPQGAPQAYGPNPGNVQQMGHKVYNSPNMPSNAWPAYAQYDNYSAVTYPSQYDASAWPYIGPYYPYPQVPLGWRKSTLSWEDGSWNLEFDSRTDRWWWFMNPKNW